MRNRLYCVGCLNFISNWTCLQIVTSRETEQNNNSFITFKILYKIQRGACTNEIQSNPHRPSWDWRFVVVTLAFWKQQ